MRCSYESTFKFERKLGKILTLMITALCPHRQLLVCRVCGDVGSGAHLDLEF